MEKISIKYLTKKSPLLSDKNKKSENNFWSLRGITFSVTEGEAIGLIGRNGSGKALLLKILAGLEEPTTGFISTKSHIYLASMTNSINFQLTGLENIKKQVDQAYDDEIEADHVVKAIIDFTEIGQWVYRPVSEYSTGMLSRLALSIALFNKPEVVLLDEVFASLERAFFEKVIRKIQDLKDHGVSFIITATTGLVLETLCERSMWLDFGEVKELGPTQIVMSKFQYQNDWYNGLTLPEKNKYLKEKQIEQENFDITKVYNEFKVEQFEHGYTRRDEPRMKKAFYHNHRQDPVISEAEKEVKSNNLNKNVKGHKKKKGNKGLVRVVSVVLVLILLLGAGKVLHSHHETKNRQVESSKKVEAKKRYSKSVSISKAEEASKQSKIESSKKEQSLAESKRASEASASSAAAASESARKASESAASESKASMLSNSQEVTVNDGDTLATLASQYGTTAQAIQDLNDMGTSNSLTAGQTIRVPNSN